MSEEQDKKKESVQGMLGGNSYQVEDGFENAEPWDPVETKVVVASFATAVILLIVFGYLINTYLLH